MEQGEVAPQFSLPATGGGLVESGALHGRPYVLYFYPKADTPGCTKEACAFQEAWPALERAGVTVIGVSRDPLRAVERFATKHSLGFPLASDEQGVLSDAYGTWVKKSMYGREYMGMERATFLVGADGRVAEAWRNVKVPGHVEAVAAAARALEG